MPNFRLLVACCGLALSGCAMGSGPWVELGGQRLQWKWPTMTPNAHAA